MIYYISDLHFYHKNLLHAMDKRNFSDVDAMNNYMIKRWNDKVSDEDEVIILGDFCMTESGKAASDILRQLKGKKALIVGNHDKYLKSRRFDSTLLEWIEPYKEITDNERLVILSHYPIMFYNGQYKLNQEGRSNTYMLYGHVHNTFDENMIDEYMKQIVQRKRLIKGKDKPVNVPCNMINCFCMFSDYEPLTLDEWIENDRNRRNII